MSKRLRVRLVIAAAYVLIWWVSSGFDWFCCGINFVPDETDEMIGWLVLFVGLGVIFARDLWRWTQRGD